MHNRKEYKVKNGGLEHIRVKNILFCLFVWENDIWKRFLNEVEEFFSIWMSQMKKREKIHGALLVNNGTVSKKDADGITLTRFIF